MLNLGNSLGSRSIPPAFNWIVDPLVLNPFLYFDGSENVTTAGGAVSSWSQVIAGDRTLGQLTGGYQPDNASEKSIDFDGTEEDRLEFDVAVAQAGVLICATNNGIFAFEVNSTSVDEITALGFETGSFRDLDLFAMVLLPTTVTDREIAGVIKYLERETGATKNPTGALDYYWWYRTDILTPKFDALDFSGVTVLSGFRFSALTSFPSVSWDGLGAWGVAYMFWGCSDLVSIGTPTGDTSGPQYYISSFRGLSSLVSMPFIDTSKALQINHTWFQCSSLSSFPALDLSSATTVQSAWGYCTSLKSFPAIDMSSSTNCDGSWLGNTAMESFGECTFSTDPADDINFTQAWNACSSLVSFPELDLSRGTNFYYAWHSSGLTSFPSCTFSNDAGDDINFNAAWQSTPLTSFPSDINLSRGTSFDNSWLGCEIVNFPALDLSAALTAEYAFAGSGEMVSFGACNMNACRDFRNAWWNNDLLATFPAGVFDDWAPTSVNTDCFKNAWDGCLALTEQSVENILLSISASGIWATDDGTSSGTALAGKSITIDSNNVDVNDLTAATRAASAALQSRGWEVVINDSIVNEYSINFNGTDEYVNTGYIVPATSTLTISAWFKNDGTASAANQFIISDWSTAGSYPPVRGLLGFYNKTFYAVMGDGTNYYYARSADTYDASAFFDDAWHHAVITIDTETQKFYLDGTLVHTHDTTDAATRTGGTSAVLGTAGTEIEVIGRAGSYAGDYWKGEIDEVAIWDVVLDADAVTAVYNSGQPINLGDAKGNYDNEGDLVSWWRMGDNDSGGGEVVTDAVNPALGSDKVVNGTFATDSDWTKETGWTISGGKAVATAAGNSFTIFQLNETTLTVGKLYEAVFIVSNYVEGEFCLRIGGTSCLGPKISGDGTHSVIVRCTDATNNSLGINCQGSSTTLDVDNFSVRELGGNAGLLENTPTFVVDTPPNYSNYALNFNGTDEYASITHDASLDFGATDDFTVSAWVKLGADTADTDGIIMKYTGGVGWQLRKQDNETMMFTIRDGSDPQPTGEFGSIECRPLVSRCRRKGRTKQTVYLC